MYTPHTWIEINQSAFEHNIASLKKLVGNRHLAIVVKSNAYGHGYEAIGRLCKNIPGIRYLCTAMIGEAIALYNQGVTQPIFVMNVIEQDPGIVIGKPIDLAVGSYETACMLDALGSTYGFPFRVHVKIDTGLSRFGIDPEDAVALVRRLSSMKHIKIVGLFTHFASAQQVGDPRIAKQLELFRSVRGALEAMGIKPEFIHVANSAATMTLDLADCNLFRVGAAAYGLWSSMAVKEAVQARSPGIELFPVLEWRTRVVQIRTIKKGSRIGYNGTYQAMSDMRVAILPVGYYDGYDFRFSNLTRVLIQGHAAPVVGRVCMNQTMVDITSCIGAKEGDEVILLGDHPHVNVYDIARMAMQDNVREITTTIRADIERVIVQQELVKNDQRRIVDGYAHV